MFVLLLATVVLAFSFQTSLGTYKARVQPVNTDPRDHVASSVTAVAAAVTLGMAVVGASYAAGYAIGRAMGHYVHGTAELPQYYAYAPTDFSAFDN